MNECDIFIAARQLQDPAEREAYLDIACAGDQDLRGRVVALLEEQAQLGSFLEHNPTSAATIDKPHQEPPGSVIGPYKLIEQIGEGGMGVVWMAEQTQPVRRKVALKVLKPGMDTRQVVARFEAERQALAIMDHPNIARVFDGGVTATGRPYFVMELVRGETITDYCDHNHLAPRGRLELFVTVCQAVQHAHQKGIIHRDLKPSNVLVTVHDTKPVVKVIDFGVAKALGQELTDKTLFTGFAQMIGTPLYMSPEQAGQSGLDIDTRSDIYSLGVLLYELLTGTTPFDKERFRQAAYDEIRRIIREEEPPKPSMRLSSTDALPSISANRGLEPKKLAVLVRGELDWIVMKALDKDRSRRYETPNSLALDLQRFLADEPVEACPPSAMYLVRKFARRNMATLATVGVLLAAIAVGSIGTAWQAVQATRARDLAIDSENRSTRNLERALASVDQMLTRIGDEKLANVPFVEDVRRELLEDALAFYRQMMDGSTQASQVRLETAMAERRVANILVHLGRFDEAKKSILRATELLEAESQQSSANPTVQFELALCMALEANMLEGDPRAALDRHTRATQLLDQVSRMPMASDEVKAELAFANSRLALASRRVGDRAGAEEKFKTAERIYLELLDRSPTDRKLKLSFAKHLMNYGILFADAADWQAEEAKLRTAIDIAHSSAAFDKPDPNDVLVHAIAMQNLARNLMRQDRLDEADALISRALDSLRGVVRDYPSVPDYRLRLSGTLMSATGICFARGDYDRGVKLQEEGVDLVAFLTTNWPTVKKYHGIHGGALSNLASLLNQQGNDLERAERLVLDAIEHQRRAIESPDKPNDYLLNHYVVLARVRLQRGNHQEASVACEEGLRIGQILLAERPKNSLISAIVRDLHEIKDAATKPSPQQ